jgi:hypothetical protein
VTGRWPLRQIIRAFAIIERPCAWILLVGGVITFISVLFNLIATGDVKTVTLLVAAGLIVDGFSAVQEAEDDEEVPPPV